MPITTSPPAPFESAPSSLLVPTNKFGAILGTITMQTVPNATKLFSGALTADTYLELVSLSTPWWLRVCGVFRVDGTSRTVGLKIIIDGTTVIDAVDAAIGSSERGWYAIGGGINITMMALEGIRFNASLSLQIKSSITETDKIALKYLTAVV